MADFVTLLQREGLLTEDTAQRARALIADGKAPEEAALEADGLAEDALLRFLSKTFDVPLVELDKLELAREFLAQFPARLLVQHRLLPIREEDGAVVVATS